MELPSSTVPGLTMQKLKVLTFIASMTVVASVIHPIIPFRGYVEREIFSGVRYVFPLRESVLDSWSCDRYSRFDDRLLKQC